MAIIKCKMCGGDLNLVEGSSVAECEFCGSVQTVPKVDDEKKLTLFARANRLRSACEFDKAAGIYEAIVADFQEEAEAYWGLLLCKYGIEYVDDPGTGKKIPTCHRSSFDSVMDDGDLEQALENADPVARKIYRDEAKAIEELRKGIIAVSSNEAPYDIFICYKETDENGDRTLDSVLAQDVYDALTDKGYRVFFSRISLEDKLGMEYEPYIFAALNSAKIMLVFGTDYEYFNAVWVKNEWSRFLKLMAKDKDKHLIPCYKGIDAYDMPKEFAKLQAQDLGKVGATQDLLRGIEKVLPRKKETINGAEQNDNDALVAPLIKRVFLFLEEEKWDSADQYCEKTLDLAPENAHAYLGKLMAHLHVKTQQELKDYPESFETEDNFKRAIQFADPVLKAELLGYIAHISERINQPVYDRAMKTMAEAASDADYRVAAELFQTILGYKDADVLAQRCLDNADSTTKDKIYQRACDFQSEQQYAKALREFQKIGDWKDAAERAQQITSMLDSCRQRYDEIAAKYQEVLTAGKELDQLKALLEKAEKDYAEKIALIQKKQQTCVEDRNSKRALESELSAIQAEVNQLNQQIQTQTEKIQQLTARRSKLGLFAGKEKKELAAQIEVLEQALAKNKNTSSANQQRVIQITSRLDRIAQSIKTEETLVYDKKQVEEEWAQQSSTLKDRIGALEAFLSQNQTAEQLKETLSSDEFACLTARIGPDAGEKVNAIETIDLSTGTIDTIAKSNDNLFLQATKAVENAISRFGGNESVAFPNTAYSLPCYYAVTGEKVSNLSEMKAAMGKIKSMMGGNGETEILDSTISSVLCAEFLEALKYLHGATPYNEDTETGFISDTDIRMLGTRLATGDCPGIALIMGGAKTPADTAKLVKTYQNQGILVVISGEGVNHLSNQGVKTGFSVNVLPIGAEKQTAVHVISIAVRTALIFGNIQPGDLDALRTYISDKIPAFVNAYMPLSDETVVYGACAINLGFPVIASEGNNTFTLSLSSAQQNNAEAWREISLASCGIVTNNVAINIPVAYSSSFEGEIIRRGDMQAEADGSRLDCFEIVQAKTTNEVEDHKITVIGPDIKQFESGSKVSLSYTINVTGGMMQQEFESVIERKLHSWLNCIDGVMHTGQRDMIRIRFSKSLVSAGFTFHHLGEVLYAKVMSEFGGIVEGCQITIVTDANKNKELIAQARNVFGKRDIRLSQLSDESVDSFYVCTMCKRLAPSHICVITPDRSGACGMVSWLDAKAKAMQNSNGPCHGISKGSCTNYKAGRYAGVDKAVEEYTDGAINGVSVHSMFNDPMTAAGDFECISAIEPCTMGVIITSREHNGETPIGMNFSDMASMTGGGVQTPGFMGHSKEYIYSKKYIAAEDGHCRIVWMPKWLKESVRGQLDATVLELYGIEHFSNMIADETVCEGDVEELMTYLATVGHPVLGMEPFDM